MNWLSLSLITAFVYGLFSFFIKLTADTKINNALAALIYQLAGAAVVLVWFLFFKVKGIEIEAPINGIWFALLGGIVIGSSAFFVFKAYSSGGNISVVAPIILFGSIIVASVLGVIFLHEKITINIIIAYILAGVSIFLLSKGS